MASTFTTNFAIEKPGTGEQSGTWGTTTNHNFDIFDRLAGYKSVTVSGTTHFNSAPKLSIFWIEQRIRRYVSCY